MVLEKTLESPLDCKELKLVSPKGNQLWVVFRRTDAKVPILWPPDVKSWLIGKYPDAGKYRRHEKGMAEDEMVGWHHWFNGHEFEQAPGDGEGQGRLAHCSPWGQKESGMTEGLNNNSWKLFYRTGSSARNSLMTKGVRWGWERGEILKWNLTYVNL